MSGEERRVARGALRDLIALAEESTRQAMITTWLSSTEEAHMRRGLWVSEEVLNQASEGGVDGRSLLTAALGALLSISRPRQVKLAALAREARLELTRATLLASLMPVSARVSRQDSTHLTAADGRSLTLGERRALARRPSSKTIERLLLDPDPLVLQHLLQNPRLTESLVLKIATHRPQLPKTLFAIFSHQLWGAREQVRRALALNPNTPLPIRCVLLSQVSAEDLEAIELEPARPTLLSAALRRAQQRFS